MKNVDFMASVEDNTNIEKVANALVEKGAKVTSTLPLSGIILGSAPEPLQNFKIDGIKYIEPSGKVRKLKKK